MGAINWNQFIQQAEAAGESLGDFTPVPAGSYDVKVFKAEAKKTKNGKDMVVVTYVIEGGPHAGRRIWHNLVVSPESPKAMAILIRQLTALGVRPILEADGSFEQIAGGMVDHLATIKVAVGEYQSKPKNEVESVSARQGGFAGPAETATYGGATGLPI